MVRREATYYRDITKYIDLSTYNRLITGLYLGYIQDIAELAPLLSRAKSTGQGSSTRAPERPSARAPGQKPQGQKLQVGPYWDIGPAIVAPGCCVDCAVVPRRSLAGLPR